jgi:hypothetical protein
MGAWAQAQSKQVLPRSDRALIIIGLLACLSELAGGRWATLRRFYFFYFFLLVCFFLALRRPLCGVTDVMAHQEFFPLPPLDHRLNRKMDRALSSTASQQLTLPSSRTVHTHAHHLSSLGAHRDAHTQTKSFCHLSFRQTHNPLTLSPPHNTLAKQRAERLLCYPGRATPFSSFHAWAQVCSNSSSDRVTRSSGHIILL